MRIADEFIVAEKSSRAPSLELLDFLDHRIDRLVT
jgi:hypothetical protein